MIPFFKQQKGKSLKPQHLLSQQVRYSNTALAGGNIDQTHLEIADAPTDPHEKFSFLVIGDTDAGSHRQADQSFSQAIAHQVISHLPESRFLIHTGDVSYPTGSYQNYFTHFLQPYQKLLTQLPRSPHYSAQDIVFRKALLSVPGNHDYSCDASRFRAFHHLLRQLCDRLRTTTGLDLGHYGGAGGEAYGQTFLDSLSGLSTEALRAHLATHYSATHYSTTVGTGHNTAQPHTARHCLSYRPGIFTRLPNRYYSFRYGGIDFFALDSNTWNRSPDQAEFDQAQLTWLQNALIRSWRTPNTLGRIVYLHHSPYTTEACHWQRAETLWVRRHLRTVFNNVAIALDLEQKNPKEPNTQQPTPIVNLVLSGHAHCLEHLTSHSPNRGEQGIDWIVCGGSGASVRPQRRGEATILERVVKQERSHLEVVAQSHLYRGRHGHGNKEQNIHSFIRVDIQPHQAQPIVVHPFLLTSTHGQWQTQAITPIPVGQISHQQASFQSAQSAEKKQRMVGV